MLFQKILEAFIRIGTIHALYRAEHPVLPQDIQGARLLLRRHGAVIQQLPAAADISSGTGDHSVKRIFQQRRQHVKIPAGAQIYQMTGRSCFADRPQRRIRRNIFPRFCQCTVNIQKNDSALHLSFPPFPLYACASGVKLIPEHNPALFPLPPVILPPGRTLTSFF